MSGQQQLVGWLGIGLILANLVDGPLRGLFSLITTKSDAGAKLNAGNIDSGKVPGVGKAGGTVSILPTPQSTIPGVAAANPLPIIAGS